MAGSGCHLHGVAGCVSPGRFAATGARPGISVSQKLVRLDDSVASPQEAAAINITGSQMNIWIWV